MKNGELHVERLDTESAWFHVGTPESLPQAASCIAATQEEHGTRIGCLEEAAYAMGFISAEQLEKLAAALHNACGDYPRSRLGFRVDSGNLTEIFLEP
jgi:glucose-1-phosphate thymidylyltransferase